MRTVLTQIYFYLFFIFFARGAVMQQESDLGTIHHV